MDDELLSEDPNAALLKVIALLKPLRQNRQAKAERQQRQLQQDIQNNEQRMVGARAEVVVERESQKVRRQDMYRDNSQKTLGLNDVDEWNKQERRMLTHLSDMDYDIAQLGLKIDKQHEELVQARQTVKERQRAVEKLSCMVEVLGAP